MIICVFLLITSPLIYTASANFWEIEQIDKEWYDEDRSITGYSDEVLLTVGLTDPELKKTYKRVKFKFTYTYETTVRFNQTGYIITDENSRIVYKWVDIDENGKGRAVRKTYISFETGDLYKIIKVDMKVDIRHYKYEDDRGEHYY